MSILYLAPLRQHDSIIVFPSSSSSLLSAFVTMFAANSSPLSDVLPPLVFGTATFNYQFNKDPYALNPNTLVERALAQGVRAFDTSPYYGPAEEILGAALHTDIVKKFYPRQEYFILTKVGRISSDTFDYSPEWVRHSVSQSCARLRTDYLDVVYCHDVEFVSPAEVLEAVKELRRIRDEEGKLRYVGISGYPVDTLCEIAELILHETGEPLDVVQSYANYTLQNTQLLSRGLTRLVEAGVDVVPNASPLGMGLLRRQGVPIGAMGNWHPAPDALRQVCLNASEWANREGEKLEIVAVRFALENWLREGSKAGTYGDPVPPTGQTFGIRPVPRQKLGVSVMGISKIEELDETLRVWRSVLDGLADDLEAEHGTMTPSDALSDHEWSLRRRQRIRILSRGIRDIIGETWIDYAWPSPDPDFVNQRKVFGLIEEVDSSAPVTEKNTTGATESATAPMLTPPSEPEDQETIKTEHVPRISLQESSSSTL